MPQVPFPSPSAVTVPNGVPTVDEPAIPMPTPHERPFPYQDVPQNAAPGTFVAPQTPVYPVLPPAPQYAKKGKRPAGGAVPLVTKASPQHCPIYSQRWLAYSFVLVQLLRRVRFVLRLLNVAGSTLWIGLIYATSGIFVLPSRSLLQNISIPIPNALEIYTLIAILVYGLFSRLIVRLLKAILR